MIDIIREIEAVHREVGEGRVPAGVGRAIRLRREYDAPIEDVWGYEYDGGSNVIEANVRSLRRKLGDRADSIETVRGLGYRFSAPVRSEADARI